MTHLQTQPSGGPFFPMGAGSDHLLQGEVATQENQEDGHSPITQHISMVHSPLDFQAKGRVSHGFTQFAVNNNQQQQISEPDGNERDREDTPIKHKDSVSSNPANELSLPRENFLSGSKSKTFTIAPKMGGGRADAKNDSLNFFMYNDEVPENVGIQELNQLIQNQNGRTIPRVASFIQREDVTLRFEVAHPVEGDQALVFNSNHNLLLPSYQRNLNSDLDVESASGKLLLQHQESYLQEYKNNVSPAFNQLEENPPPHSNKSNHSEEGVPTVMSIQNQSYGALSNSEKTQPKKRANRKNSLSYQGREDGAEQIACDRNETANVDDPYFYSSNVRDREEPQRPLSKHQSDGGDLKDFENIQFKGLQNHFSATLDTILPSGQYQNTQEIFKQKLDIATDKSQQDADSGAEHSNSISSLQQDMRHNEKAGIGGQSRKRFIAKDVTSMDKDRQYLRQEGDIHRLISNNVGGQQQSRLQDNFTQETFNENRKLEDDQTPLNNSADNLMIEWNRNSAPHPMHIQQTKQSHHWNQASPSIRRHSPLFMALSDVKQTDGRLQINDEEEEEDAGQKMGEDDMLAGMKLPQKLRINSEINENNFGTGVILDDNQISVVIEDELQVLSENILSAPLSKVNTNLIMNPATATITKQDVSTKQGGGGAAGGTGTQQEIPNRLPIGLGQAKSAGHVKNHSKQNVREIHQAEIESSREGGSLRKKNGEMRQGVAAEPQTQFRLSLKETQLSHQSPSKAGVQTGSGSVIELVLSEQQVRDQILKEGVKEIQFVSKDGANRGTFILVQQQLSNHPVASRKHKHEAAALAESTPPASQRPSQNREERQKRRAARLQESNDPTSNLRSIQSESQRGESMTSFQRAQPTKVKEVFPCKVDDCQQKGRFTVKNAEENNKEPEKRSAVKNSKKHPEHSRPQDSRKKKFQTQTSTQVIQEPNLMTVEKNGSAFKSIQSASRGESNYMMREIPGYGLQGSPMLMPSPGGGSIYNGNHPNYQSYSPMQSTLYQSGQSPGTPGYYPQQYYDKQQYQPIGHHQHYPSSGAPPMRPQLYKIPQPFQPYQDQSLSDHYHPTTTDRDAPRPIKHPHDMHLPVLSERSEKTTAEESKESKMKGAAQNDKDAAGRWRQQQAPQMSTPQFCEKDTSEDNIMNESRRYAMHHNSFYNENEHREYSQNYPPYFYGSHWDSGMNQAVARPTHQYYPHGSVDQQAQTQAIQMCREQIGMFSQFCRTFDNTVTNILNFANDSTHRTFRHTPSHPEPFKQDFYPGPTLQQQRHNYPHHHMTRHQQQQHQHQSPNMSTHQIMRSSPDQLPSQTTRQHLSVPVEDARRHQDAESGERSNSIEDDSGSGGPAALDSNEEEGIQSQTNNHNGEEEEELEAEYMVGDSYLSETDLEDSTIAVDNRGLQQSIEEDATGPTKKLRQHRQVNKVYRGGIPIVSSMNFDQYRDLGAPSVREQEFNNQVSSNEYQIRYNGGQVNRNNKAIESSNKQQPKGKKGVNR